MKYYFRAIKNIFNYKGEASQEEFWSYFGIGLIVNLIATILCKKLDLPGYVFTTYQTLSLLVLYPLGFRRLREAGFSGWLFLLPIINLILASLPKKESNIQID